MEYFNFKCDVCGREVGGVTHVNGMNFCAKCYQETFGLFQMNKAINDAETVYKENILLFEEGSVDTNKLDELGVKYIAYKKGSPKPEFIRTWEKIK